MEKKFMYVDDIAVELNGEKNVLEVIRKAGIDMPLLPPRAVHLRRMPYVHV